MKNLHKLTALAGVGILALAASPAAAQSAEETINVGLTVEVDVDPAAISGLEDVSLNIGDSLPEGFVSNDQAFCLFSPTQFFSLTLTGTNTAPESGQFALLDSVQTDPDLNKLIYFVAVYDTFSGSAESLGGFTNGTAVTGIDSGSFNTDPTCSDGENLSLEIILSKNTSIGATGSNGAVIAAISDGQPHNYTDQLTLLVEPEI